jgi:3-isopropylmalate/(R)-2-methylmalate dehydratase small subunit
MIPFTKLTSVAAPLDRVNVDTDQIIPKQFLKRIERTGFGEFAFFDWRYKEDGTPNPDFELNDPAYEGAQILIAGRNFGCGSSREHAPWALNEYGVRAIIAPSFADIFRNNCIQNGMLPVILPEERVQELMRKAQANPGHLVTVDLVEQMVSDGEGFNEPFTTDAFERERLLNGLDDIGMTLQVEDQIAAFEQRRPAYLAQVAESRA